ncbi:unnamed protein product, partial [Meganyctiphanes norvegica]
MIHMETAYYLDIYETIVSKVSQINSHYYISDNIESHSAEFDNYLVKNLCLYAKGVAQRNLCCSIPYSKIILNNGLQYIIMGSHILPGRFVMIITNIGAIGAQCVKRYKRHSYQTGIWSRTLSPSEILHLASCENNTEILNGNLVSWNGPWTIHGDVTYSETLSLWELCNKNKEDIFVFPNITATDAFHICHGIGGHLPIPESSEELHTLQISLFKRHNNFNCDVVWAGMTDLNTENDWVDLTSRRITSPYWQENEPDGGHIQNCAGIRIHKGVGDFECNWHLCATCLLKKEPTLTLYGVCERLEFNTFFGATQNVIGDIWFRGYSKYTIVQDNNGTWVWKDWINNINIAHIPKSLKNMPLGRKIWTLDLPICGQKGGETRELLFTACGNGKFSCDDGSCVSLQQRCDMKLDCHDGSDERNCVLIDIPDTYRQDIAPVRSLKNESAPLNIKYHIYIESIDIDTRMMQMHVNFRNTKVWYDSRLKYLNLNEDFHLNQVPKTIQNQLWSPMIEFLNTKGVQVTKPDESVLMWISKQGQPKLGDLSRPREFAIYSGAENPISVARKDSINFQCYFDLRRYPFDEQKCTMELIIVSANFRLVQFDEMSGVKFEAEGSLMEYTVDRVEQSFNETHSGFKCLQIKVSLRRRSGHTLLNVYVPSILLLGISYLTFFFKIDLFQVRILASITILLVTATIFTQLPSSLRWGNYDDSVGFLLKNLNKKFILQLIVIRHVRYQNLPRLRAGCTYPSRLASRAGATHGLSRNIGPKQQVHGVAGAVMLKGWRAQAPRRTGTGASCPWAVRSAALAGV